MVKQVGRGGDYGEEDKRKVHSEIQKERSCEYFTPWQQGFTPKEHREMLNRDWMLNYQKEREESDRKWQAKQQTRLVIIAGIFKILGAIITVAITLLANRSL